jgi:Cys-tRNA(Pro) deacylase
MVERGEREVVLALQAAGHEQAVIRFDRPTETAEAAAKELGVGVQQIVKSLVFSCGGEPAIALLPGDRRADMKAVARILGSGRIRMADPESVLEWTGFTVGSVPPLGHASRIPLLMDEEIPDKGAIYPAAGEKNNVFETTFENLLNITGAKLCRISKEANKE